MNASVISSATSEITEALRDIVAARVDHQMATVHAASVATLIASGMSRDEVRARLIAKVMAQ